MTWIVFSYGWHQIASAGYTGVAIKEHGVLYFTTWGLSNAACHTGGPEPWRRQPDGRKNYNTDHDVNACFMDSW